MGLAMLQDGPEHAMRVLNHEAVVGGLVMACDVHGDKAPEKEMIIIKQLMEEGKASSNTCKKDICRRDGPTRLGDNAA